MARKGQFRLSNDLEGIVVEVDSAGFSYGGSRQFSSRGLLCTAGGCDTVSAVLQTAFHRPLNTYQNHILN